MKQLFRTFGLCLLTAGGVTGAPIQINYTGAAFDTFSYGFGSQPPINYTLRGTYDTSHRATASIVLAEALPAHARISQHSTTRDITTGAALSYVLNVQSLSISDGINTINRASDVAIDLETDAAGEISALFIYAFRGSGDYDNIAINTLTGDSAEYSYEFQRACAQQIAGCPGGYLTDTERATARTSQTGTWSVSASLGGGVSNISNQPASAPLPAGGVLILSAFALFAGLHRWRLG